MFRNSIIYKITLVLGVIVLGCGLYMYANNIKASGILSTNHGTGGVGSTSGDNVIISGSFAIALSLVFIWISVKVNKRTNELLKMEAKQALEGKRSNGLRLEFNDLMRDYTSDLELRNKLWDEIVSHYSEKHRRYHTLKHLESVFELLKEVKPYLRNWNAIRFAVFYHDIIYDASRSDNEEQSAILAENRLSELKLEETLITKVYNLISSTKTHESNGNSDADFLLDADLSILGENEVRYQVYSAMIREEFNIYADNLYVPGRIKVLNHFLTKEYIYKTEMFRAKYEKQARTNLREELNSLNEQLSNL